MTGGGKIACCHRCVVTLRSLLEVNAFQVCALLAIWWPLLANAGYSLRPWSAPIYHPGAVYSPVFLYKA